MGFNERLIEQLNLKIEFLEDEKEQLKIQSNSFKTEIEDMNLEIICLKFDNWAYNKENEKLKILLKKIIDEED